MSEFIMLYYILVCSVVTLMACSSMRRQPPASESERLNEKQTVEENGLEGGEDCSVNVQREPVT